MSKWRVTDKAGWDERTGKAVYTVTKDSPSLNAGDQDELKALLERNAQRQRSAKRMEAALSDLTVSMAKACEDGMTELSESFCEAREALGEWRKLQK